MAADVEVLGFPNGTIARKKADMASDLVGMSNHYLFADEEDARSESVPASAATALPTRKAMRILIVDGAHTAAGRLEGDHPRQKT